MADVALDNLNDQLQPIYTNLMNLQGVQMNAVAKQQDMMNIVDFEQERLQQKQNTIDQAVENQKRIIYFNDNSRKVYSAWLYILLIVIIVLGVIYIIRVLHTHYSEIIPEMVFSISIVGVVAVGLILCFRYWSDIRARDNYNFDELNLKPPIIGKKNDNNNYGGLGLGSLVGCIGAQCCTPPSADSPGTKWDPSIGKCLYGEPLNSSVTSTSCPTSIPSSTTGVPYSSSPPVVNPTSSISIPIDNSIAANEAFEVGYSPV
jgi:preprotein translocase subunit Sss1